MVIALLWYFWDDLRLKIEKYIMATQFSSIMFEMDNLNIEKLLKNVEFTKSRFKSCEDIVLLFWKSAHQVVGSYSIRNKSISTHAKIILAKEDDLSFVRTK